MTRPSPGAAGSMPGPEPLPARLPTVLHVRASGGLFGADRVVLDLCTELGARGYRALLVPLVEPDGTGSALRAAAAERGLSVRPLAVEKRFDLRRPAAQLARLAAAEGALILHGHDYKANVLIRLAGVPATWRVATLHGRVGTDWKLRFYEWLESELVRRFDRVICVSESIGARASARGLAVIPNGIDVAAFASAPDPPPALRAELGLPPEAVVLGSIGRLSSEKGLDLLLRAAARLLPAHPTLHVLLVGEGPERSRLEGLARSLGLSARVHLPGFRIDTPLLYRLLDVVCMPSHREGLPLALLEALAAGRAAVVTPVGGVLDVLAAGEEGGAEPALRFPVGDLATCTSLLDRLLSDPALRRRLGAAGQARVAARFSRAAMAAATAELYDGLIGGAPVR